MFGRLFPCSMLGATCSSGRSPFKLNLISKNISNCCRHPQNRNIASKLNRNLIISDSRWNVLSSRSQLLPSSSNFESRRHLFKDSDENKGFCPPKKAELFRLRDGIPKSYTLVYRSDFGGYVVSVQIVIFLSIGALIVAAISKLHLNSLTEEERQEIRRKILQTRADYDKKVKESELTKAIEELRGDDTFFEVAPHPDDVIIDYDLEPEEFALAIAATFFFGISLFKMQRMIPVRIYINQRDHCVAVKYGHILPGRTTHHEFLAGSIKPVEKWYKIHSGTCFQDSVGNYLVFMPRFFRKPADYNKLLGYDQEFAEEVVKRKVRETEV